MESHTNPKNEIKAIIFDLGNVLIKVDFDRMLINQIKESIGGTALEVMEAAYNDILFRQFCTGMIDSLKFYEELSKRYNLNMSFEKFKEKWCNIFELIDGMPELLTELGKKFKIGLLSDTDPIHWQFVLDNYPFLRSIKNPTLSFETGYMKPNPELYQIAAGNVNHSVEECLFIDDRLINVEGAQKAGMKAVEYLNAEQLKKYLEQIGLI